MRPSPGVPTRREWPNQSLYRYSNESHPIRHKSKFLVRPVACQYVPKWTGPAGRFGDARRLVASATPYPEVDVELKGRYKFWLLACVVKTVVPV